MNLAHPSQFETPLLPFAPPSPPVVVAASNNEKSFGKKIKKAFYITLLFIVFMHSFVFIDKAYVMFSGKPSELVMESTKVPTIKGYFVVSFLVFCITLWIIHRV